MSPLGRSTLILLVIVVLTAVMMFFLREDDIRCPDGLVPALSNDRWICVKEGGKS